MSHFQDSESGYCAFSNLDKIFDKIRIIFVDSFGYNTYGGGTESWILSLESPGVQRCTKSTIFRSMVLIFVYHFSLQFIIFSEKCRFFIGLWPFDSVFEARSHDFSLIKIP